MKTRTKILKLLEGTKLSYHYDDGKPFPGSVVQRKTKASVVIETNFKNITQVFYIAETEEQVLTYLQTFKF